VITLGAPSTRIGAIVASGAAVINLPLVTLTPEPDHEPSSRSSNLGF
jgi:hypothetical protein